MSERVPSVTLSPTYDELRFAIREAAKELATIRAEAARLQSLVECAGKWFSEQTNFNTGNLYNACAAYFPHEPFDPTEYDTVE